MNVASAITVIPFVTRSHVCVHKCWYVFAVASAVYASPGSLENMSQPRMVLRSTSVRKITAPIGPPTHGASACASELLPEKKKRKTRCNKVFKPPEAKAQASLSLIRVFILAVFPCLFFLSFSALLFFFSFFLFFFLFLKKDVTGAGFATDGNQNCLRRVKVFDGLLQIQLDVVEGFLLTKGSSN